MFTFLGWTVHVKITPTAGETQPVFSRQRLHAWERGSRGVRTSGRQKSKSKASCPKDKASHSLQHPFLRCRGAKVLCEVFGHPERLAQETCFREWE